MEATIKNVQVLSVENNDFVNKEGKQVFLSNVNIYNQEKSKVMELAIRDNNQLAGIMKTYLGKTANVDISLSQAKGGYSFFVNLIGISKNGGKE